MPLSLLVNSVLATSLGKVNVCFILLYVGFRVAGGGVSSFRVAADFRSPTCASRSSVLLSTVTSRLGRNPALPVLRAATVFWRLGDVRGAVSAKSSSSSSSVGVVNVLVALATGWWW